MTVVNRAKRLRRLAPDPNVLNCEKGMVFMSPPHVHYYERILGTLDLSFRFWNRVSETAGFL